MYFMKKKKAPAAYALAAIKQTKNNIDIEKYLECLLEGGAGGGGPVPTANGTNKKKNNPFLSQEGFIVLRRGGCEFRICVRVPL